MRCCAGETRICVYLGWTTSIRFCHQGSTSASRGSLQDRESPAHDPLHFHQTPTTKVSIWLVMDLLPSLRGCERLKFRQGILCDGETRDISGWSEYPRIPQVQQPSLRTIQIKIREPLHDQVQYPYSFMLTDTFLEIYHKMPRSISTLLFPSSLPGRSKDL